MRNSAVLTLTRQIVVVLGAAFIGRYGIDSADVETLATAATVIICASLEACERYHHNRLLKDA